MNLDLFSDPDRASPLAYLQALQGWLADAGRTGPIIRTAGAGPDHPIHPLLPESAYLKAVVLALN